MKRLLNLIFLSVFVPALSAFGSMDKPNQTLLWNRFVELKTVSNFVLALSDQGIAVLQWDEKKQALLEVNHVLLQAEPLRMKLQGSILVVRDVDDGLAFVDVARLPEIALWGRVIPATDYYDFVLVANELFLSRWFDGIDQYHISDYKELNFTKNDKSGVLMTQLEVSGNYLFALDMYNGIIRYEMSSGFGSSVDKLLVDKRPFAFSLVDSLIFISMNSDGAKIGRFNDRVGEIVGEVTNVPSPDRVLPEGSSYVFLSPREINLVNGTTLSSALSIVADSQLTGGDFVLTGSGQYLLLPKLSSGIISYRLSEGSQQREVLYRPGPINSVLIYDNYLFTGGSGNPLEMHALEGDSLGAAYSLRGETIGLTDLAQSGGQLFAMYSSENKIIKFDVGELNGIVEPIDSFSIEIESAQHLKVYNNPSTSSQLLLVISRSEIEAYSNVSGSFEFGTIWTLGKPIVDVAVVDGNLYVTDRFDEISAYEVTPDLSLVECSKRNLTGTAWAMQPFDNHMFVFTGNILAAFNNCLELDTILRLPTFVLDAEIEQDTLLTIGPNGIGKYNLTSGLPVFIESGGLGGNQIAANSHAIATTDGGSLNIYFQQSESEGSNLIQKHNNQIVLYDNYPEPFNASTVIQYELAVPQIVQLYVFNLMGQKVRTLVNQNESAGRHKVSWNSITDGGTEAASGVYFYRLVSGNETHSRKMLLIK